MEHYKKLIQKKRQEGKGKMGDVEASARGSVLNDMIGALGQSDAKKVKGLKKVTVASNSTQGLAKGIDTAKELIERKEGEKLQKHEGAMRPDSQEEEYDDQDAQGPNHIPTEDEASSFHSQDPKLGSPLTDENSDEENEEIEEAKDHEALKAENDALKLEIERLKAPRPHY